MVGIESAAGCLVSEIDEEEWGAQPEPGGQIIPFPAMRPNSKLDAAWKAEVARSNEKLKTAYKFHSPIDVIGGMFELRGKPLMHWPPGWREVARRAMTYPGDVVGIVGAQGGGKTSLAIQICLANASAGVPVVWDPLELNPPAIVARTIGNIHGVHASTIQNTWSRSAIEHAAAAFTDMWKFVDYARGFEKRMEALRRAVDLVQRMFRVSPVVVIDHVGKLAVGARDPRAGTIEALEAIREFTEEMGCYTLALSQGSRGTQGTLTGKVDHDSAADAIGAAAESKSFEDDCSQVLVASVFKTDYEEGERPVWFSHMHLAKLRHTGMEGKIGFEFWKPGGQWRELDYLPATPTEVKARVTAAKKDKHTVETVTPSAARSDLNAAKEGDAAAAARVQLMNALTRHGAIGMAMVDIRKLPGVGRGAAVMQRLQELERSGSAERATGNRWRIIPRH